MKRRILYGVEETPLPRTTDGNSLAFVHYRATNGRLYTFLHAHQEKQDDIVFRAELIFGEQSMDITEELKQLAGPEADFHFQDLTLGDIVQYISFVRRDHTLLSRECSIEYQFVERENYTIVTHVCNDWNEILKI